MTDFATLTPRRVTDPRWITEICRLRAQVWHATGDVSPDAFPTGEWRDLHDDRAAHWIVLDHTNRLVAAARLVIHHRLSDVIEAFQYQRFGLTPSGRIAAPDHVVVRSTAQGQGIAAQLLAEQERAAQAAGATVALRQASPRMIQPLLRRGWRMLGPALADPRFPQVPFTVAVKDLGSSRLTLDATWEAMQLA